MKKTLFYFSILILTSCQNEENIESYLLKLSKGLKADKYEKLKETELDSTGENLRFIHSDVNKSLKDLKRRTDAYMFLDSITRGRNELKVRYVSIAIYLYVKEKRFNHKKVKGILNFQSDNVFYNELKKRNSVYKPKKNSKQDLRIF